MTALLWILAVLLGLLLLMLAVCLLLLCVRTGIYLITKECDNASEAIDAANYARKYAAGNCETGVKLYDEELKKQSDAE